MYEFIDTAESAGSTRAPAEAVSINGTFLEDLIDGYRTLYTSGRESLGKEFSSYDDTGADGSLTRRTRFPARTITVGFQLLADSPDAFRAAFNAMNAALNVENVRCIFNDEPDKFFVGSPIMNAEIEPGRCAVKGEYQIYCADPFKYSVDIQMPQPVVEEDPETGLYQTFVISYDGTYPAYPQYTAKFYNPDGETDEDNAEDTQTETAKLLGDAGACKFVAFMDDENHVLQFGNPDLEDSSGVPDPLTLTSRSFEKNGSYDPGKNGEEWVSPATGTSLLSKYRQQGSLGTGPAIYGAPQTTIEKNQSLLGITSGTDCKYKATITRVTGRTASKVKLDIEVKLSSLKETITKGASLTIEVTCGDTKIAKVFKKTSSTWKKKTSHHCNFSMPVNAASDQKELSGIKIKVVRQNGSYKSGKKTKKASGSAGKLPSKTCNVIEIPYYVDVPVDKYYVRPSEDYGNVVAGAFTGPAMTWTYPASGLPATDDGIGAATFELTWNMLCCIGKTTNETLQMGAFECLVLTGDSMNANGVITNQNVLAGVQISKTSVGTKGRVQLYVGGVRREDLQADLTWNKGLLGNKNGFASCSITKDTSGNVTFKLGNLFSGKAKSYADISIKNRRAFKVVFGFYRYAAQPAFDWNGINRVMLKKLYGGAAALEKEPFSATQTLIVDSAANTVTLDGVPRPELGALGNDWEQMCLRPGVNEISTAYAQRPASAVQVIRHCREDEPFQGVSAYDVDDTGGSLDVAADGRDVRIYFVLDASSPQTDTQGLYIVSGSTDGADGKKRIRTKTGQTFVETALTADAYDANPAGYLVVEDPVPQFEISYREVYL